MESLLVAAALWCGAIVVVSKWRRSESGSGPRVLRELEQADLDGLLVLQQQGSVACVGHIFPQNHYPFPVQAVRQRWEQEIADPGIDCFAVLDDSGVLAGLPRPVPEDQPCR